MKYVIFSPTPGYRAIAEGSNACSVLWTTDPRRARQYEALPAAEQSAQLLTDDEDSAYVTDYSSWLMLLSEHEQKKTRDAGGAQ